MKGNLAVDKYGGLKFDGNTKKQAISWATNAVNCAGGLFREKQDGVGGETVVYLASDSNDTVSFMIHNSTFATSVAQERGVQLVGAEYKAEPLHIDYSGNVGRPAEDFYSGFEDLWILASARCVAYGLGGYGHFAARLTGDSCMVQHRQRQGMQVCPSLLDDR